MADPMKLLAGIDNSAEKSAAFERDVVKHILRRGGFSKDEIATVDSGPAVLGLDDLWAQRGRGPFPFCVAPRLIDKFSIEDIFERPTKSGVVLECKAIFDEHRESDPHGRPVAMPFKTFGLGKLVALDHLVDLPSLYVPDPKQPCCIIGFDRWLDKIVYGNG